MRLRRRLALWIVLMGIWVTPLHTLHATEMPTTADRLRVLAERERETFEQNGGLLRDPALDRYLRTVANRLWEQADTDLSPPVIEVIKDSRMKAYTYPDGYILVSTGILDPIENEDQLAMILAHEMVHYIRQHAAGVYDQFQIPLHGTGDVVDDGKRSSNMKRLAQEVEAAEYQADREGLAMLEGAGYCRAEVLPLLSHLIERLKDQATAAAMATRRIAVGALIDQDAGAPSRISKTGDAQRFSECIAPALMANAQTALRRGEWDQADHSVSRYLSARPADARAYYLRGEIMLRRDAGEHQDECIRFYEAALKIDPRFPSVQRALGELYFKAGRYRQAKSYFEAFLALAPRDEASAYIRGYLHQCQD